MARENRKSFCIGLMSRTSVDGMDVVITDISGEPSDISVDLVFYNYIPYSRETREAILRLFQPNSSSIEDICDVNFLLGEVFADAIIQVVNEANVNFEEVLLIGTHGQSIYHSPTPKRMYGRWITPTLQMGESAVIAEKTGCPVVSDFHVRDVTSGGQGAPLVSYVDSVLFSQDESGRILANIGEIANVTYLPPKGSNHEILAFDTGPGNMIIDGLVKLMTNGVMHYDKNGEIARLGKINESLLNNWMDQPRFFQQPPNSAGREFFGEQMVKQWWSESQKLKISGKDLIATATEYTIRTFSQAISRNILSEFPVQDILIGGEGSFNPVIMEGIQRKLPDQQITSQDLLGIMSDSKEAVAFAVLGYECFHKRTNNLSSATGARHPVVMGKITWV